MSAEISAGVAEPDHDHFMAKVPKVLGETAPKFLGTAPYTNGTGAQVQRQIYIFPKRETGSIEISATTVQTAHRKSGKTLESSPMIESITL